jgi:hypothetical protein
MWNGFVGKQISRSNRNLLTSNLALMAIPVALGVLGMRYWTNFFAGPAQLSPAALAAIPSENHPRNYVSITGEKPFDTGYQEITETKRRGVTTNSRISANFILLRVGDKVLPIKAKPEDKAATQFTGELRPIHEDFKNQVLNEIFTKYPEEKGVFFPYMLDQTNDYPTMGYFGLVLGLPCLGLAAWNLQKLTRRWGKPENHPLVKQFANRGDLATVTAQIDAEMSDPATQKIGKITITPNWFFRPQAYGLDSLPLENLVWFYQKVTTHRTNGVPTGKTYSTVLHDRDGRNFEFSATEKQVDQVMNILYDKAPWAISGYSDEIQAMWRKQRSEMVATVDERRQAA